MGNLGDGDFQRPGFCVAAADAVYGGDHILAGRSLGHNTVDVLRTIISVGLKDGGNGVVAVLPLVQLEIVGVIRAHRGRSAGIHILRAVAVEYYVILVVRCGHNANRKVLLHEIFVQRICDRAVRVGGSPQCPLRIRGHAPYGFHPIGRIISGADGEGIVFIIGGLGRALEDLFRHFQVLKVDQVSVGHVVLLGRLGGNGNFHVAVDAGDGVGVVCAEG